MGREFSYSFYVTRRVEKGCGIYLDKNGNIVSVSERMNVYKGGDLRKNQCRTQNKGDKDFESLVTRCLRMIFGHVDASDLIEALNQEMREKYFEYLP